MFKNERTFPAGKVTTTQGIEANRELYIVRGEQCCATDSDIEKAGILEVIADSRPDGSLS